jgi:NADH:ubiquinone oxidoreductase subunit F (NADH-binding)
MSDMTPARLLMNFEVTPTSHLLADYKARGGYTAIEKAIRTMTPKEVTDTVTASGIQGRGGANFSAGRK